MTGPLLAADAVDPVFAGDHHAAAFAERELNRVGDSVAKPRLDHDAIDHRVDVVLALFVEPHGLRAGVDHAPVDAQSRKALGDGARHDRLVLSFFAAHQRREELYLRALRQGSQPVRDLLGSLSARRLAAPVAVLLPQARIEHAQVVVDLRDGADSRSRVVRRGLLLNRDGRREASNALVFGLFHLPEKLPRVRREALDVATLTFGKQGIERQRRLAAARGPRHDDEALLGNADGDVLEVVLAGSDDHDLAVAARSCPRLPGRHCRSLTRGRLRSPRALRGRPGLRSARSARAPLLVCQSGTC